MFDIRLRPLSAALVPATLLALTSASCEKADTLPTQPTCASVTLHPALTGATYEHTARIETAELVDGGCLRLTASYSGGCAEDELRVAIERSALTVYPPIYSVTLYDAAEDPCEAMEQGELTVDLAAVRAEAEEFELRFVGNPELSLEVR